MSLVLNRLECKGTGVFGELIDTGSTLYSTLEHAYLDGDVWAPKIPPGDYTCVRGLHRLHGMDHDFETFEITGVPGHIGLLFHWGNFNRDSEGCVLVGEARVGDMITESRRAFAEFMDRCRGVDTFQLKVT